MQIKKTYNQLQPELLYDELKDTVLKQGVEAGESKLTTYSVPDDSSSFVYRGLLTFKAKGGKECLRAHIVGSARGETRLMVDIDETLFPKTGVAAMEQDLGFIFGSYEAKRR
ncbi:MAG: hypothetical protein PVJ61_06615 [Dehalococcoidia bacterium]|jgi:hypothetical protein